MAQMTSPEVASRFWLTRAEAWWNFALFPVTNQLPTPDVLCNAKQKN
jgi:hypothetical protein